MFTTKMNNRARAWEYVISMAQRKAASREVLARNLKLLMERREWAQMALKEKSGVSQRHISSLINQQQDCTTDILGALAAAFHIPPWLLLIPDLPPDMLDSKRIPELVDHYVNAGPTGQDFIDRMAEREAAHREGGAPIVPIRNIKAG